LNPFFSLPPAFEDFNISQEFETLVKQLEREHTSTSPPVQNTSSLTPTSTPTSSEGLDLSHFKSEPSIPTPPQNIFLFEPNHELPTPSSFFPLPNNNKILLQSPTHEDINKISALQTSSTLGTFMGKMIDEKEKRRVKRREQNQRAQQKLRDKRKAHQDELEKKMLILNSQNQKLDYTVNQLYHENKMLRNQINQLQSMLTQQQAIINNNGNHIPSPPISSPSTNPITTTSTTASPPSSSDLSSSPSSLSDKLDEWLDYYEDDKLKAKELYYSENESSSSSNGGSPKDHFEMRFPIGIIPFLFVNNWTSLLRVLVIMLSVIVIALIVTKRGRGSILKTIFSFLLSELNLYEFLYGTRVKKNEIIDDKFQLKKHSAFALVWNGKEL